MDLQLSGKTALITGSTAGIGAETARMLAAEGASVIVHGRDRQRAQAIVDSIEATGGRASFVVGDLAAPAGIEASIETIVAASKTFGAVDILVNNVGGSTSVADRSWFETSLEEWASDYDSNVLAAVRLIRLLVPSMRERGWGRVIQVSSRNAISPHPQFPAYGAAKAALNNMTLSLSKALAGTGVTANGIMPGLIATQQTDEWFTEMARTLGSDDPMVGQRHVLTNIVRQTVTRAGQPRDIAAAVCFLASPLSDFTTGATLRIDGGATPTI